MRFLRSRSASSAEAGTLLAHCLRFGGVCLLAAALAGSIQAQSGPSDFVILKADDLSAATARLTIILVSSRDEAASIRLKLQAGASFDALAAQYSRHPSAATGGDFGVFSLSDLRPEFRSGLDGVKSGGYTDVIAIPRPAVPPDWPEGLPIPGASLKDVELALGRSYSTATIHADGESTMQELTYPFGVRVRIHERRGLGFMEFTAPWKFGIFGIRPDDPLPGSIYDSFPRNGRFIRGVYAAIPGHPNWFVDVDDRVDAVMQLLFVDRRIYGDLPGLPKSN